MDMLKNRVAGNKISNPFYQGFFGTNNKQVNFFIDTGFFDRLKISDGKIQVGAALCCTGITGSNKEALAKGALRKLPGKGMFPAAGAG